MSRPVRQHVFRRGWAGRASQHLLQALFPSTCALCGAAGVDGQDICPECLADLPHLGPCCQRCALPLIENGLCGQCLRNPPCFDRCIAALRYQGPTADLITGLKFQQQLANARLLAWLLWQRLRDEPERAELLIPVPLHPHRLRERGYNQALELARPLARQLGIPLSTKACVRQRATHAQSELPKKQRLHNLRGAFALQRPLAIGHVALLDDVITTGSTANELARVLKAAGVERVDVWAIARTP